MQPSPQATPVRNGNWKQNNRKRQFEGGRAQKRQRIHKEYPIKEGSNEEVLLADIRDLFARQKVADTPKPDGTGYIAAEVSADNNFKVPIATDEAKSTVEGNLQNPILPVPFTEVIVKVVEVSSTGEGLAMQPASSQIYVVPFTAPGDVVKVKVIKHFENEHYSMADFVSVVEPSPLRDDSRINCKYFQTCSGCQFQMLDYPTQLEHKKMIVEKAYKNFSQLPPELVPVIEDTIGSPLQYGYRTKLTPHFDGPPGYRSKADKRNGVKNYFEEVPNIGFTQKGTRKTLDIEDCPIGTDAVRMGMQRERKRVAEELKKYQRGATILLRESTLRIPNSDPASSEEKLDTIRTTTEDYTDFKSCVTDNNGTSTEYINDYIFTNIAGSFFQNNNSILPIFTQYIRDHILPPFSSSSSPEIKYLIDAYSGSGLFTITLSSLFTSSTGIDISTASIESAHRNAKLNGLLPDRCTFISADATELFKSVTYPPNETVVVIDPPRKGCDENFLKQLLRFKPRRVVYVSCNVHTQARDVGFLVRGSKGEGEGMRTRYKIESLRGFDFFPQTGHVEGVAVLSRVDNNELEGASIANAPQ